MVSQSIDALLVSYSEPETNDILSNCSYIVVLQATTSKTQKQIVEWCGKFKERKRHGMARERVEKHLYHTMSRLLYQNRI